MVTRTHVKETIMAQDQGNDMKGTRPDPAVDDPSKDVVATAGQQDGGRDNQQSGQQGSQQQSGNQQSEQQRGQQSQQGQQGQQQGNQQSGQQGGGQHASGGTPALDDLDGQRQGESARDASQVFQQDSQGKRQ